jgi:hypothetical protein
VFELQDLSPEEYRRQTRRIGALVIAIFAVLGMVLAAIAVRLFGEPGANNFRWNLIGVLAGVVATALLVRFLLWDRPFMAPAAYGWRLKRSLMRVTNILHRAKAGVAAGDPSAMKLMRFYHLGLTQMYRLDGNLTALEELAPEKLELEQRMAAHGIPVDQSRLDPAWLEAVKQA